MFARLKTIITIVILILSVLIMGCNCGLVATSPENESHDTSNIRTLPRSNGGFNWSQIEVLSEPEFGQNLNIGLSKYPKIAVEDNKIYMVWQDNNNTNGAGTDNDIFYRYLDGNIWSDVEVISEPEVGQNYNDEESRSPAIAVENGKIFVVWYDRNNTNGAGTDDDIFYRCNLTGYGWEPIQVISEPVPGYNFNSGSSKYPDITVENGNIYVVWADNNDTNGAGTDADLFYRCNLTGFGWEDTQVISEPVYGQNFNTGANYGSDITVVNGKIYVVWEDSNNTNGCGGGFDTNIFYRCNLTGSGWEDTQVISEPVYGQDFNVEPSKWPSIAVENDNIFIVWMDANNTYGSSLDFDIFFKCNRSGSGWDAVQLVSEPIQGQNINTHQSWNPSFAVENDNIFIAWSDQTQIEGAGPDHDIFYITNISGSGWEPVQVISEPVPGQNISTGTSYYPSIAVENSNVYVVWQDINDTNGAGTDEDIFYREISTKMRLFFPKVTPILGNTSTYFNFTVKYYQIENTAPTQITVNISGTEYPLLAVEPSDNNYVDGKGYFFNITHLDIGVHTFRFWVSDGVNNTFTRRYNNPTVYNTAPNITTLNNLTVLEDEYYQVSYDYDDIDVANVGQPIIWDYSTNASWLAFDNITAILNGTPTQNDIGRYWINISINDTMEIDWTNFTISVIEVNDDPIINTTDDEITYEDELYKVDYNATDIDSPLVDQVWSLGTNATSWLSINSVTGIISGTPTNDEVGIYGVNVSVDDGENGLDFTNFTLTVLNVNDPPVIITSDLQTAPADTLYEVDYNATDIDSPLSQQIWSLTTNASWLGLDSSTGVLSGTPTEADAGWYDVNVSVDDDDGALDWHEFVLTVTIGMKNEPPVITTTDVVSATVDELYYVDYTAIDDYTPYNLLVWSLATDANWLSIETATGILTGTPLMSDVGQYWVNVSVMDEHHAVSFHNFTLTVYSTVNQPPSITTTDQLYALVNTLYSVDYDATDDRTPVDYLQWSVLTNASWLSMHTNTGLLTGMPGINDVGWYIVNVTVFDGEDGWDYHNFVLTVTSEPIDENTAPELSNPTLTPSEGDVETEFTFTVHYYDTNGDAPSSITVFIDNGSYGMTLKEGEDPANGIYTYGTKLTEGNHTYYFIASDGTVPVTSNTYSTPYINLKTEPGGGKPKKDEEANWWIWVVIVVIIVIVVLVLLFLFVLKKKPKEEPTEEERLAEAPPPQVPPEQPPEEVPSEVPPAEQPLAPEAPPEQPPAPEVTSEPQVEEQPPPTVEPQATTPPQPPPQVAPQEPPVAEEPAEPQVQPQEQQVPTVKKEPAAEEE